MPSLDFEVEKQNFREYYNDNHDLLERAKDSLVSLIASILSDSEDLKDSVILGRVKDREECIKKFSRKYQTELEEKKTPYEILNYISDLAGIRIICLYEEDVYKIKEIMEREFDVFDVTDKIEKIESSENLFGYKGLHVDIKLKSPRSEMIEYKNYTNIKFEVQIRTTIQDAWSVLDHKIKYKKSIPHSLKRRINTLAAIFELADREFFSIKQETTRLKEEIKAKAEEPSRDEILDVFSFLSVVEPKFENYFFAPRKVDGFVEEINSYEAISPRRFKETVEKNFSIVERYKDQLGEEDGVKHALNPFTMIRHVMFLEDQEKYKNVLYENQRSNFQSWLEKQK